MKQRGILHPELLGPIASAGTRTSSCVTDAGRSVPAGAKRIDLGLACGVPTIVGAGRAMSEVLVVEVATVATQFREWKPDVYAATMEALPVEPGERPHQESMADMASRACAYVKTGECTAQASIALVWGVSYLEAAIGLYSELHGEPPAWPIVGADCHRSVIPRMHSMPGGAHEPVRCSRGGLP